MTPWQLRQAAFALRAGNVVAHATETVFGLGCNPLNAEAVETILQLKRRPITKGLILVGANLEQLLPYINVKDQALLQKLEQISDRPTTWVCPARENIPYWLTGQHSSIAVRITTHPIAHALCQKFGQAIVSTSANPSGLNPARTRLTVQRYFNQQLDYILGSNCAPEAQPSRIIDLSNDQIIRK